MRTTHWLFAISMALFVTSIGFVIAAARTARMAPAPVRAAETTPIASVRQIMNGITGPAADTVFQAVGSTITAAGIEETAPRNDQEWEKVGDAAAALIESGNLMLMEGRMVDHGDWVRISKDLIAAGKVALEATRKKDADALLASGEAVNQSCDACHQTYRRN